MNIKELFTIGAADKLFPVKRKSKHNKARVARFIARHKER